MNMIPSIAHDEAPKNSYKNIIAEKIRSGLKLAMISFTPDLKFGAGYIGQYIVIGGFALIFPTVETLSNQTSEQPTTYFFKNVVKTAPENDSNAILIGSYIPASGGSAINLYGVPLGSQNNN